MLQCAAAVTWPHINLAETFSAFTILYITANSVCLKLATHHAYCKCKTYVCIFLNRKNHYADTYDKKTQTRSVLVDVLLTF